MCNGIEVVRADGEVYMLGSCAVVDKWFGIPPMPDLTSLFLNGWFGTTGIITKLSLQLLPKPAFRDYLLFTTSKINEFADAMYIISKYEICEDLVGLISGIFGKMLLLMMVFSAHFQEELDVKRDILRKVMENYRKNPDPETGKKRRIKEMKGIPSSLINEFFILPPPGVAGSMGDIRKGGGAEYIGSYIPLEAVPEVYKGGRQICKKYGLAKESYIIRAISLNHSIMFALNYPYNRKSEEERKIVEKQLAETTELILKAGGIPWKPDVHAQKKILEQTNRNYIKLMKEIKNLLDPNNILNPGKWE
jgi:FAD/FMN-containing dehydrogenase